MEKLPFPLDKPLAEIIKTKYLKDALKWVGDFRDPLSSNLLGTKTGNIWGVGYGLLCLLKSRQIYLTDGEFPGDFDTKAHNALQFLLDKASFGQHHCNWDDNIWDTSVVCRALLYYMNTYPENSEKSKVFEICCKAVQWLYHQVETRSSKRYSLGIPDLSQMLRTFLLVKKLAKSENCTKEQSPLVNFSLDDAIHELVSELIHSAEVKNQLYDGESEKIVIWDDDVFATADAIISLSRYIQFEKPSKDQSAQWNEIITLFQPALRFLELEQVDGKWGIEETTTIALQAYILGYKTIGEDQLPEPHIVFKAIRYLCDPKTVFSDGSIAHKMEPTIYMILAFLELLENWKLPNNILTEKSVHELYDYIIWNTPTRSTHERVKRMQIQSEASILKTLNNKANKIIQEMELIIIRWRTVVFLLVWGLIGYAISFLFRFIVIKKLSDLIIPMVNWKVSNWEVLLTFLTLWGGFGWFIYDRVLRWNVFRIEKIKI